LTVADPPLDRASPSRILDAENPWPGLLSFREVDAPFFRGRSFESEALVRLVARQRLSVLFGLSGLGKSSLLRAGLFPRVRPQNMLPVYVRFDFSGAAPDLAAQVRDAIAREADACAVEAPAATNGESLWEYFHRQGADFWDQRNRPIVPLLVVDQFEELFTVGRRDNPSAAAIDRFLAELVDLVEGRPPLSLKARLDDNPRQAREFSFSEHPYKILLCLREDFLPELEGLRERVGLVTLNRLRLRRMNGEAALGVMNQAPNLISPEVAERVVRFVAATEKPDAPLRELAIEPALLSVVCRELNNKRQERGDSRITEDLLEGSQQEILTGFFERSVADLGPEVRTFMEERLLTVSGYRDTVALENALSSPGVTRAAIDRLVEKRLVRIEDRAGVARLELTHDLLTRVIVASRARRREREAAARESEVKREADERERQALAQLRRSRYTAAAFLALGLVACVAAAVAWRAQKRAKVALHLAAEAESARAADEEQHKRVDEARRRLTEEQATALESLHAAAEQAKRDADARTRQALELAEKQRELAQAAARQLEAAERAKKDASEKTIQAQREAAHSAEVYSEVKWVPATAASLPKGAYQGGQEKGRPLYVCRGRYENGLQVGAVATRGCSIGYDRKEVVLPSYEVLLDAGRLTWIPGGSIPWNAVAGGEENGLPLYVCRGPVDGGVHPGKVVRGRIQVDVLVCNIGSGGREIVFCPTCSEQLLAGADPAFRDTVVMRPYEVLTWR
jgi:hypothetical protein